MIDVRMTASQAKRSAITAIQAGLVPYIRSSPGLGKSAIAKEIAEEFNLKFIDIRLSMAVPEDLMGLPMRSLDGKTAEFLPFNIFPTEETELPINPKTGKPYDGWLILLDEFSSAGKMIQAASYKLVLDRMVGNHNLHKKVAMIAAGNLETDAAIVNPLSTAMQSRFVHIELKYDREEWIKWAHKHKIDHRIMAYLEFRTQDGYNFDPKHQDKTYPCPRTWEFCSKIIKNKEDLRPHLFLLAGTISAGVAVAFETFTREYEKIPKLPAILRDPEGTPIPTEASTMFATVGFLMDSTDNANFPQILKYITRFPNELQILFFRGAFQRTPALRDIPEASTALMKVMRFLDVD